MKVYAKYFLLALLVVSVVVAFGKPKVYRVTEGTDVISAAYESAEAGDIIELTTSGGHYLETDTLKIKKSITIRGAAGLEEKPVFASAAGRAIELRENASLWLKDFKLTGMVDDGVTDAKDSTEYGIRVKSKVNEDQYKLVCDNVHFDYFIHGKYEAEGLDFYSQGYTIRLDDTAPIASELRFENCIFTRAGKYVLRARAPYAPPAQFERLILDNCTVAEIGNKGVLGDQFRAEAFPSDTVPPAEIIVNHCTFANNNDDAITFTGGGIVKVTNSIFKNLDSPIYADRAIMKHCDTINVGGNVMEDTENSVVENISGQDPEFADPDNWDFTVGQFFDVTGNDGLIVGDLRWVSKEVHQVAEGTDVISAAYENAEPGDIIELTTSGGNYLENDTLKIKKSITLRGAAGLEEKPVFASAAGRAIELRENASLWLKDFKLTGMVDDGVTDAKDSTEYGIRVKSKVNEDQYKLVCDNVHFDYFIHGKYEAEGLDFYSQGYTIRLDDTAPIASELRFENCIFTRAGKYVLRARAPYAPPAQFERLILDNCTVAEIGNKGVLGDQFRAEAFPSDTVPPAEIIVNHCTFANNNDDAITFTGGGIVKVTNSIFKNLDSPIYADRAIMKHCDTINVGGNVMEDTENSVVENISGQDPEFADPDNWDFTVGQFFDVTGNDGLIVGDLRWVDRSIHSISTDVEENRKPGEYRLAQNYPNPFNPVTNIAYALPEQTHVQIAIYNMLGQEVATLVDKVQQSGKHTFQWNARSDHGNRLSSGIYFYRLSTPNYSKTRKMILMK